MKKYVAEFLGTFGLVFCGTGAIVINQHTNGVVGHMGIAITFGAIVTAMIYCFGNISGAHLNPAVTLGLAINRFFSGREVIPYLLAQIAGAFAASFLLKVLFPLNINLGTTLPSGSDLQSFILEIVLTFFLMLTILFTARGNEGVKPLAGLIIGTVVLLEAMFAGPVCGASMNPARSLAPALVSGHVQSLWVYLIAPIFGSLSASFTYRFFS